MSLHEETQQLLSQMFGTVVPDGYKFAFIDVTFTGKLNAKHVSAHQLAQALREARQQPPGPAGEPTTYSLQAYGPVTWQRFDEATTSRSTLPYPDEGIYCYVDVPTLSTVVILDGVQDAIYDLDIVAVPMSPTELLLGIEK